MLILRIFSESFASAIHELLVNRLRTFLTLMGISIGIFCVITIFSAVDSLENNLKSSIGKFGNDIVYISKWPWSFGSDYPWWEYWKRPHGTYNEMRQMEDKLPSAKAVGIVLYMGGKVIKQGTYSVENAFISGVSYNYDLIQNLEFSEGRFFTQEESFSGQPVCIIGASVSEQLFPGNIDPVGRDISLLDRKLKIVGLFAKEGESIMQNSNDNAVMIPYNFLKTRVYVDGDDIEPSILVKANAGVSLNELKDEIRGVLRGIRRQRPTEKDNFAMNQISFLSNGISSLFSVVDWVGLIIGGFAILVGGFGIANIMFVSVRERTNIIGIKKALGAKSYFILLEFLVESVILSIIGGLLGLFFVYLILIAANNLIDFQFVMSMKNILTGISISAVIGLIAGLIPAISASRLHPVDAIRFK